MTVGRIGFQRDKRTKPQFVTAQKMSPGERESRDHPVAGA
jgi:hypothetical protein